MLRAFRYELIFMFALLCASAVAQQPDSQLPDAPQQQPQAQPPRTPPPSDESRDEPNKEKKQDSKIKRTLKRGAPNCIKIGGAEKCKESSSDEEEANEDPKQVPQQPSLPENQPLPRSSDPYESSSKDTTFPEPLPGETGSAPAADVRELRPYNPHKADKDVEVGDFYFKRNNYRAAESRYAEALEYMPHHAVATYKLAEAQEKLGKTAEARANYQQYLKILPRGEFAELAQKALARLGPQANNATSPPVQKPR